MEIDKFGRFRGSATAITSAARAENLITHSKIQELQSKFREKHLDKIEIQVDDEVEKFIRIRNVNADDKSDGKDAANINFGRRGGGDDYLNNINARVGAVDLETKRMRELEINAIYQILELHKLQTRHGDAILAYLRHPRNGVPFKVFLPSRTTQIFPTDEAIAEFMNRVNGVKVTGHTAYNSVNLEFCNELEEEEMDDVDEDLLLGAQNRNRLRTPVKFASTMKKKWYLDVVIQLVAFVQLASQIVTFCGALKFGILH
ncbi:hypothetical protein V9T40_004172 [Parthenolecanium corni]|uniref:Uncharacterized protein n=1 Tax=Parthenolecanium corni TaxID=536013 RepID=A0AAN9U1N5_9HEMI